jgi:hypothetical protein
VIALEPDDELIVVVVFFGIFALSATKHPYGGIGSLEVDDLACGSADALFKGSAPMEAACIDAEGRSASGVGAALP